MNSNKTQKNLSFFDTNGFLKIIGILWKTFILAEKANFFYIIDQHTVYMKELTMKNSLKLSKDKKLKDKFYLIL